MSDRPVPPADPSDRHDRKERLRGRLKAGAFTVLFALGFATGVPGPAAAAEPPRGVLEQRIEQVRATLGTPAGADRLSADTPAQPWGNIWLNWGNGWHNWNNSWHNWNNWHNWSDWNNWNNSWHNWFNA